MEGFKHPFFFYNFFSSVALLENLTTKNIFGTGTIRENRIPGSTLCDSKLLKKSPRGTYDYIKIADSSVVFIKWNDNNIVTFCSNAVGVNPVNSVKRYSQKDKRFVQIDQPNVVKLYNRSMGGVYRSDQNISLYRTAVRGKKWYFPLLAHCIDMALHNAWQIHKHHGGTMDQLTFRRSVANVLLVQNKKKAVYQLGHISKNRNLELRYDRLDHWVIPQEKQTRCAACHQKTTTRCKKCDIGLHVKCFLAYHTK
jgi:Transposase IS4